MEELPNQGSPHSQDDSGPGLNTPGRQLNWAGAAAAASIILFILIFAVFAYWFFVLRPQITDQPKEIKDTAPQNQPSDNSNNGVDTSNWKEFSDTSLKLGFKYPNDWILDTKESTSNVIRLKSFDLIEDTSSGGINVTRGSLIRFFLSEEYKDSKKPLIDYVKEDVVKQGSKDRILATKVVGEEAVRVDEQLSLPFETETQGNFVSTSFYINHKDRLFQIARLYPEGKESQYEEVFIKILSNVKFLD